jgi:hypothetical protein
LVVEETENSKEKQLSSGLSIFFKYTLFIVIVGFSVHFSFSPQKLQLSLFTSDLFI